MKYIGNAGEPSRFGARMRSARAIRTTEKPARSNSIPWQRTVRGGSTGPHIAIGSKSRQQTVRGASIRNKSWQQTVHGASTGPHIRVRALIAAADAFHGIGLARLFALLSQVSHIRVRSPPDPTNEKATPIGVAFHLRPLAVTYSHMA